MSVDGNVIHFRTDQDAMIQTNYPCFRPATVLSSVHPGEHLQPARKFLIVVDDQMFYFELKILSKEQRGVVAVGLACKPYPAYRLPGWNRNSVAFHSVRFTVYFRIFLQKKLIEELDYIITIF
jgi:hypothetical protein